MSSERFPRPRNGYAHPEPEHAATDTREVVRAHRARHEPAAPPAPAPAAAAPPPPTPTWHYLAGAAVLLGGLWWLWLVYGWTMTERGLTP